MFESLDDQMKHDREEATSPRERYMKWVLVAATSLILFGCLFMGVRLLS